MGTLQRSGLELEDQSLLGLLAPVESAPDRPEPLEAHLDAARRLRIEAAEVERRAPRRCAADEHLGAGKRLLTGESLFMTVFTNEGQGKQRVAFGAPYPGTIIPMELKAGEKLRVDTGCLTAFDPTVQYDIEFV